MTEPVRANTLGMRTRISLRPTRLAGSVAASVLTAFAVIPTAQAATTDADVPSGTTVHFSGRPEVGALFDAPDYTGANAAHFCTASVIASPRGNLVLTAAHCVYSASKGMYTHPNITFAPGYGQAPRPDLGGVWSVAQIDVAPAYLADGDPESDYAILVIAPQNGHEIQHFTGALLPTVATLPEPVEVVGYNDLEWDVQGNEPIECRALAFEETEGGEPYARFNCPDFQDGSSGGPWIVRGTHLVMGVIGGYEQGGDSPDWSYSALFGANLLKFYRQVAAAE